jgi:DNA-binding LacI/PurR family transcriptional regulator
MLKSLPPFPILKNEVRQNRFRGAYDSLHELVYRLGPESRLPTVSELRQTLGVSLTTLDAVLGQLESENLILRRRGSGIFVSPLVRKSVCLLCNQSYFRGAGDSAFWYLLVEEAEKRAEAKNENLSCHFVLSSQERDENEPLARLIAEEIRSGRIHGVLSVGLSDLTLEWLNKQEIPVVSFASSLLGTHNVQLNGMDLLKMGAQLLAEKGCVRPQLWTSIYPYMKPDQPGYPPTCFQQAMKGYGVPPNDIIIQANYHMRSKVVCNQEAGYDFACRTFSQPRENWPDGILIDNDLITHGALAGLMRLKLQPEHDVQIISHSNAGSPLLKGMEPCLDLVEFDPEMIVAAMFDALETLMNGQKPAHELTCISPRVRRRGTSS